VTHPTVSESDQSGPEYDARGDITGVDWRLGLLLAGIIALGVLAGMGWLLIIVALVVMITLHELGHYLTAKWSGMKVTEFFLFFGPKIWSFKRGETEYGIKLIPLGAYVRIIGMSNIDPDVPPEDEHRTYRQQSYPKRLLVVSAGSIMHLLQAFVLFVIVFSVLGVPGGGTLAQRLGGPAAPWSVDNVVDGSAADEAGLRPGDRIESISGRPIESWQDLGDAVAPHPGDDIDLVVLRGDRRLEIEATLGTSEEDPSKGFLGIGPAWSEEPMPAVKVNPVEGVMESGQLTVELMGQTVSGLASFFGGGVDDMASSVADGRSGDPTVSGSGGSGGGRAPQESDENRLISIYGVARIGAAASDDGMVSFLILLASVNISIGLLNMIPLLPLDGGHVAIATYERIRSIGGRRHMADVSRLLPITYAVVLFMALLGVSAIYLDIVDPIG
jgi:membrane-associated protease RseP (regulator of RpoE activity)